MGRFRSSEGGCESRNTRALLEVDTRFFLKGSGRVGQRVQVKGRLNKNEHAENDILHACGRWGDQPPLFHIGRCTPEGEGGRVNIFQGETHPAYQANKLP